MYLVVEVCLHLIKIEMIVVIFLQMIHSGFCCITYEELTKGTNTLSLGRYLIFLII